MAAVDHVSLARQHLARADRSNTVGDRWEATWRAFEQTLWHHYRRIDEGEIPRLLKLWAQELPPEECRRLADGESMKKLLVSLLSVPNVQTALERNRVELTRRVADLRRACRQGVPLSIVVEALHVCRIIRNDLVHGLKISANPPDRQLLSTSLPLIRAVAELSITRESRAAGT
jgi:hypothetical protein